MFSLTARLLLTAVIVLAGFLGATGWTLDKAFRNSAEAALQERLQTHIYALIAASELGKDGIMRMPGPLAESRFSIPGSGLYAQITAHNGDRQWQSFSKVGIDIPFPIGINQGDSRFQLLKTSLGSPAYAFSFGLAWKIKGKTYNYTFSVGETLDDFYAQVNSFRRSLWTWLGGMAVLLLVLQALILRWGLSPLRRVADDLAAIESGVATKLEGQYPSELRSLTTNLNALIRNERAHIERYRHTLDDLAHSLKTPLAILQGLIEGEAHTELRRGVQEQVDRMSQIVEYQLRRAATSGRTTLMAPIALPRLVQRIVDTLYKVHADKKVACRVNIDPATLFYGEEGDFLELIGNLLDNAFKWCKSQILIEIKNDSLSTDAKPGLTLIVEDDGAGIPVDMAERVLQRGVRADESTTGHGIGLAIVQDIVHVYAGKLVIGRSSLGGTKIIITLPAD